MTRRTTKPIMVSELTAGSPSSETFPKRPNEMIVFQNSLLGERMTDKILAVSCIICLSLLKSASLGC